MNFISICSINFDIDGALYLQVAPENNLKEMKRRTSKTQTLDGGVVISDFGYGYADNDFQFTLTNPTPEQVEVLRFLFEFQTALTLSTASGFYIVSPSVLNDSGSEVQLTLLVNEKVV